MKKIADVEGVKAQVQKKRLNVLVAAFLVFVSTAFVGCYKTDPTTSGVGASSSSSADPNETAATVNGKAIKLEEVERGVKQQAQGQESKLSPLELASARLQVLDGLIQNEVLYQKAEKEGAVPKDDDVTTEVNKRKTASGLSQEKFDDQMKQAGMDDAAFRDTIKKGLAVQNLIDKITGKIEPPKDKEIDDFYAGNKSAFLKKRGVKLAAIVVDPADNGEGDTTKSPADVAMKIKEIGAQLQGGADFASVAREKSEDNSRVQGGDLGYISEEQLRQNFSDQIASGFMNPQFPVGKIAGPFAIGGKYYILKLQERSDKDENLTLESPGIRQQVIDSLLNARKQLLSQSYAAIAMNEAKIENYLAQKVVNNPNELSGARPAGSEDDTNSNTNSATGANTNSNAASANAGNANAKPSASVAPNGSAPKTAPTAAAKPGAPR